MITFIRLLSTIAIAAFALTAVACVANPTPHPGSGDNSGMGMADNATDGAFAAGEAERSGAASEADEMAVDNAPEPNGPTSAEGADSGSEVGGDAIASDDAGPDGESDPCEGPSVDFLSELMSYQGCASDDECQLLVDENSCECTRAIAVSDLEGAQALLDGALLCAEAADDVLGPCIADAAPTGNVAFCADALCQVETPSESCLIAPESDASEAEDDALIVDEDAGPDVEPEDAGGPEAAEDAGGPEAD